MTRRTPNLVWKYFDKYGNDFRAYCSLCKVSLSYKSTTGNLRQHLKYSHSSAFKQIYGGVLKNKEDDWIDLPNSDLCTPNSQPKSARKTLSKPACQKDEESNSSIKFSSEIWGHFDQEDSLARCTLCQKTTENTVEDMRNHLEEDHPAVLISILDKKPSADQNDNSDEEMAADNNIEEEAFTEVVYLEEEVKRKPKNPLKRTKRRPTIEPEKPRIEYKVISQPETRPEIDSFLNYIGVLLKNVPKDSFPKLQLDVISLILNAQMPQPVTIPTTAVISVPTQIQMNDSGDYHITIQNKNEKDSNL